MCGRTSLFAPAWLVEERFDAEAPAGIPRGYNIAPREYLAVIRDESPGKIDALEWGLVPSWADSPGESPQPINARAEPLADNPVFRTPFERRRCLVLADGFYEWSGRRDGGQPYRFVRHDNQPFAMAAVWDRWSLDGSDGGRPPDGGDGVDDGPAGDEGERRADGDGRETVSIVTTEANETMAGVHDRMPVVFEAGEADAWLEDRDTADLQGLLDPPVDDLLRSYPVSRRVNDPTNDDPGVVARTTGTTQAGLGDFGG